jgi:2-C-methyl-D-erythritol 4-phosphate cytidylyltransferase
MATAIVLAAGRSERLAGPTLKPFRHLAGRPILDWSLAAFGASATVASIVVVVPEELRLDLEPSLLSSPKVCAVTGGGPTRQESLGRGLARAPSGAGVVAVHDAARPLVEPALIDAVVGAVSDEVPGAVPAIPLDDALKEVGEAGRILAPRSRASLWRAQTPQAFTRGCLEASLARAIADGVICDDCSEMATRAGYAVRVVPGDPWNIKVTRPADLDVCEGVLSVRLRAGVPASPSR